MAKKGRVQCMIRLRGPGQPVRTEDLLGTEYTVGRGDPDGNLRVDFTFPADLHLSRQHCKLVRQGDTYAVENLSPNGTYVNGKLIEKPVQLGNKDKIEIGSECSVEFLAVSDTERAKLLTQEADTGKDKKKEEAAAGAKKKSVLQNPLVIGIVAFYAVVGAFLWSVAQKEDRSARDPGDGPYFQDLLTEELRVREVTEETRDDGQRMWARALEQHGGEALEQGPHAYYLIDRARHALAQLGFATLEQGVDAGQPMAIAARDALAELETRVAKHYQDGKYYVKNNHWEKARESYERILDAVPDRNTPIRQFALYRVRLLDRKIQGRK